MPSSTHACPVAPNFPLFSITHHHTHIHTPPPPSHTQLSAVFEQRWAKHTGSSTPDARAAWQALVTNTDTTQAATTLQQSVQYILDKGVGLSAPTRGGGGAGKNAAAAGGQGGASSEGVALYFNGRLQGRHGDWQSSLVVPALYEMQRLQVCVCHSNRCLFCVCFMSVYINLMTYMLVHALSVCTYSPLYFLSIFVHSYVSLYFLPHTRRSSSTSSLSHTGAHLLAKGNW